MYSFVMTKICMFWAVKICKQQALRNMRYIFNLLGPLFELLQRSRVRKTSLTIMQSTSTIWLMPDSIIIFPKGCLVVFLYSLHIYIIPDTSMPLCYTQPQMNAFCLPSLLNKFLPGHLYQLLLLLPATAG